MEDSKFIQNGYVAEWQQTTSHPDKGMDTMKKSSSFDENKLMRTPEAEPREFVYVYSYRDNRTRRMKKRELLEKLGDQNYDQAKIPYSIGSIPICTGNDGFGGGETVVARVHVNTALRLQRWLGMQKRLYIVDAIKS
ncbi:hypothetical protein D6D02_00463 [Aureobasidium pullulans]|uniref:Uncharacterized protein n=1 Tax=Aureobasidium pullulans TaxID=5580 RepID=A0A4S9Z2Z8_AURPU|nr:hypothetical protein D6D23_03751 [Aureobasidium pullulans]THW53068.1 hypothetical protein D6D22_00006 [Aureobasidium pullulans]THW65296.1 hypothetical protein D6D20_02212 [Aureobasidium pullulans]THX43924.1 hypothetical protein D6D10_00714 [Aureobasidium pullulans]THY25007.1 hypothetical protein D6D02_00463 [Aureobasidium pullulans]